MRIAINTRQLSDDFRDGNGYFVYETIRRIVENHPEHEFLLLSDRSFATEFHLGNNVKQIVAGPEADLPLFWKWWLHIKVPAILRRHKADVFVSYDGGCSFSAKIPQCLIVPELPFLYSQSTYKKSHLLFYKRNMRKFLNKAKSIATITEFVKNELFKNYHLTGKEINVLPGAINEALLPASDEIKKEIKDKYTSGKEYFIYAGEIHPGKNIVNLLKAFSIFKKKQKTGMKLVLAGRFSKGSKSLEESMKSYKYRDDVIITGLIKESVAAEIISAAYAMVHPVIGDGFAFSVLASLKCGVPVIASTGTSIQEIAGDAVLFADVTDIQTIAEKMILLYKDENLRNNLIERGKPQSDKFNWDKTATVLWQLILKTME